MFERNYIGQQNLPLPQKTRKILPITSVGIPILCLSVLVDDTTMGPVGVILNSRVPQFAYFKIPFPECIS